MPQKILIIQAQLLQTPARHIGEFELDLFRCPGILASFGNIARTAAGSLHHLVMRTAARIDIKLAKTDRHIVD
jgi:hypothetical protein